MRSLRFLLLVAIGGFATQPLFAQKVPIPVTVESTDATPGWGSSYDGALTLCQLEREVKDKEHRLQLSFWRLLSRRFDGHDVPLIMLVLVIGVPAVSPLHISSGDVSVELSRPPNIADNVSFGSDSPAVAELLRAHRRGNPIKVSFQSKDGASYRTDVDTLWLEVSAPMFDACAGASPNNKLQRKRGAASESTDG
jgi:hypothetical protein